MKWILCFAVLVSSGLTSHAATDLPSGVHPISGIDETLPVDDLTPLNLIGSARIVGLGESIHTSGGYLQAKFRLIKFLVEKMGFRNLLMETPLRNALATSRYIATCEGPIDNAMTGIFPVFAAKSTEQLFDYLCHYNQNHPQDPVHFFGFDTQEPYNEFPVLQSYVQKAAPSEAAEILAGADQCLGVLDKTPAGMFADPVIKAVFAGVTPSQALYEKCLSGLNRTQDYLVKHKSELLRKSSQSEYAFADIALKSLYAFEDQLFFHNADISKAEEARDQGLAQVASELYSQVLQKQKTILWAANYHLSMDGRKKITPDTPDFHPRTMGSWLKDNFQDEYFPIGFIGYKVEINWSAVPTPAIPTAFNSVEVLLHKLGHDYLLVDSKTSFLQAKTAYVMEGLQEEPFSQYRALLYFDYTPGMIRWNH